MTTGKEKHFGPGIAGAKKVAIGIDQSLTGFAFSVISVHDPVAHDTWVYKSPYNGVQRLADISHWLREKLSTLLDLDIVDVAMEGTVLASHSALVLGELAATVKLTFWSVFAKVPSLRTPLQIPPMTLKKYATGKGNAKKQEMLMQIYKRWDIEFNDDNAADAYALARLAGKVSIDAVERAVVDQILDSKYRDAVQ